MKTDPDFHPVASAWLDGRASQPEQGILREILSTEPGVMREFSSLCQTEVLLRQAGTDAVSRRESLGRLMTGKTPVRPPAALWKNRIMRWGAAAALFAIIAAWAQTRPINDSDAIRVAGKPPSASGPVTKAVGREAKPIKSGITDQLPEAAPGFELLLKRFYIADFKASGPLPETAALLVKDLKTADGKSPEVEIVDAGDAPVSLALDVSLPAWTLFQIMALQSGTRMEISGQSIVFLPAESPSDRVRSATRSSNYLLLAGLLPSAQNNPAGEDLSGYSNLAHRAFGSRVSFFFNATKLQAEYTGPVRDVDVLQLALHDIEQSGIRVNLSLRILDFQAEPGAQDLPSGSGHDGFSLAGVYTDAQFQVIMREFSRKKGVNLMTLPSIITSPNLLVSWEQIYSEKETPPMPITARVVFRPSGEATYGLRCEIGGVAAQEIAGSRDTLDWKGEVTLWDGQTVAFTGFKHPDGWKAIYLTASLIDSGGLPLAPDRSEESPLPLEDFPDGIPSPWIPGFFISPFAPAQGEIDLTAIKSGSQVQCPFTGKLFRKP